MGGLSLLGRLGKYPKGHEKSAGVGAEVVQGSRHCFPGVLLGFQPLLAVCQIGQGQSEHSGAVIFTFFCCGFFFTQRLTMISRQNKQPSFWHSFPLAVSLLPIQVALTQSRTSGIVVQFSPKFWLESQFT